MTDTSPIILAYSGGLDTSFCVPWLKETYNRPVVTVCINTGGLNAAAAASLEERAMALGAQEHLLVEARQIFFDRVLKYLIAPKLYPPAAPQWHRLRHMRPPVCPSATKGKP